MRICYRSFLSLLILMMGSVLGLSAQETIIVHFEGFGYEEGGFDFSAPGDIIHLVTRVVDIDFFDPAFPYDPITNEYTLVVTGLVSNGEMVDGIETMIIYNLGMVEIFEDPAKNSTWDEYPGFPDPPSTFMDGNLWLYGDFTSFMMLIYRDYGFGSFEGFVSLAGGSAIDFFTEEGYTFGGTLVPPHNPGIPPGYDLSLDGKLLVEEPVSTGDSSWSSLKALF